MTPERLAYLVDLLDDLVAWMEHEYPTLDVAVVSATAEIVTRLAVALTLDGAQ